MKIPLTYGFIGALAGAALTLLLYFGGFHDSVEKFSAGQWIGGIGGLLILIVCLVLALREKRATAPASVEWGYGSALGAGLLTALTSTVLGAIANYIYFVYVNPHISDVILAAQQAKMEQLGLSAEKIAAQEEMMRKWMSPGISTFFQAAFAFFIATLVCLIVAIFFRERRENPLVADAPPPLA
ncbi:MAG TPA: DUF4199 domain-containing protein [Opitutaceae bacterium]|nr:DUF4199 domain-containing protein [Opitutaceae bacterium]